MSEDRSTGIFVFIERERERERDGGLMSETWLEQPLPSLVHKASAQEQASEMPMIPRAPSDAGRRGSERLTRRAAHQLKLFLALLIL